MTAAPAAQALASQSLGVFANIGPRVEESSAERGLFSGAIDAFPTKTAVLPWASLFGHP